MVGNVLYHIISCKGEAASQGASIKSGDSTALLAKTLEEYLSLSLPLSLYIYIYIYIVNGHCTYQIQR